MTDVGSRLHLVGPFILGRILSNLSTLNSTGTAAQGSDPLESKRPIDHGRLAVRMGRGNNTLQGSITVHRTDTPTVYIALSAGSEGVSYTD